MFGFLAPLALFGLGLLAIPIVLHIFKPRKVRQMPFSSLRWLRASQHRMSKKLRWHQVLLLLLRMGLVTALVLALATPVISSRQTAGEVDRFIVLDTGQSMAYQDEEGYDPTPLQRGKDIAEDLIGQVSPGDRTGVLHIGASARALGPMVGDASIYVNKLQAASVEPGGAPLTDVLRTISPLRNPGHAGEAVELYFITDNAAHKWSQGAISRFMDEVDVPVHVNVIDVSPEQRENAWIATGRLIERESPRRRLLRVQLGAVGTQSQTRTVSLTGVEGVAEQAQSVTIEPGAYARVYFELPPDQAFDGQVARLNLEPADGLAADDTYWVNLDASTATRVLVVEPETTQVAELQPGYHLRTALRTLNESAHGGVMVVRRAPTQVLRDEIARADAILLVEVPELSEGDLGALKQRVREGAGLGIFLGPSINSSFYNNELHDPLQPRESLLPVALGEPVQQRTFSRIARVEMDHPLFRGLFDPVYGDLGTVQFQTFFRLQAPADDVRVRTLASIGGAEPAILERSFGSGRVLLINTTANDAWTDLPRHRSFVPLVNRLVQQLAGTIWRGTFTVGSTASVPLPVEIGEVSSVQVRSPNGDRLSPTVLQEGGRRVIQMNALREVGVYQVTCRGEQGDAQFPFVVQPDAAANLPTRMNEQTLEAWWAPATVQATHVEPGEDLASTTGARWLLTPWLLLAAFLFFVAEMFFVHWLCPRANPALSQSFIGQQGFFGSTTDSTAQPTPNLVGAGAGE